MKLIKFNKQNIYGIMTDDYKQILRINGRMFDPSIEEILKDLIYGDCKEEQVKFMVHNYEYEIIKTFSMDDNLKDLFAEYLI